VISPGLFILYERTSNGKKQDMKKAVLALRGFLKIVD
jgi:hypothetical protein